MHSPHMSGLAFRSGGRNSTKIDEIDFRLKSKSPFLAANIGKINQVDRLHSYGMLDDKSEPKNSENESYKRDVDALKSEDEELQLSGGIDDLNKSPSQRAMPAEPGKEPGL